MLDLFGSLLFEVGPVKYQYGYRFDLISKHKIIEIEFHVLEVDLGREGGEEIRDRLEHINSGASWGTGYGIFNQGRYPYQVLATVLKITREVVRECKPDFLRFRFIDNKHWRFWRKLISYVDKNSKIYIENSSFGEVWTVSL